MTGTCKTCIHSEVRQSGEMSVPYCELADFPVAYSYSCGDHQLKLEVLKTKPKLQDCLLPLLSPLESNFERLNNVHIYEVQETNRTIYSHPKLGAYVFPTPTTLQQLQLDLKRCGFKFTIKSSIIKIEEGDNE